MFYAEAGWSDINISVYSSFSFLIILLGSVWSAERGQRKTMGPIQLESEIGEYC